MTSVVSWLPDWINDIRFSQPRIRKDLIWNVEKYVPINVVQFGNFCVSIDNKRLKAAKCSEPPQIGRAHV